MAKYADYVKKQDQLDTELEKPVVTTPTSNNVPDSIRTRFAGKTAEEVMESFAEAQTLISRQGQELGELRKTTQTLLELQSKPTQQESPSSVEDEGVTVDDLYADPEQSIGRVYDKKSKQTSDRIAALEHELATRKKQDVESLLEHKFPGWKVDVAKPDFLNWIVQSPARARLARAAEAYDADSANDLLELWYEKKGSAQKVRAGVEREQQFRDASLESSSPTGVENVPTFSRNDLTEKRIAAKQGNRIAERWLNANGAAITLAYQEGRITD